MAKPASPLTGRLKGLTAAFAAVLATQFTGCMTFNTGYSTGTYNNGTATRTGVSISNSGLCLNGSVYSPNGVSGNTGTCVSPNDIMRILGTVSGGVRGGGVPSGPTPQP